MDINKVYSKVEDFLKDDEFIKTVLGAPSFSVPYLEKLKKANYGCSGVIDAAVSILKAEATDVSCLTDLECRKLKDRIFRSLGY